MPEKRPLGISILAVVLMVPSPFLLVGGIAAIVMSTIRVLKENLGEFGLIMILMSVGVAILGLVCAKAGFGLWRLKTSARAPTIFLMCMIAVFTGIQLLFGFKGEINVSRTWIRGWVGSCIFSVWAVIYLCLPQVRRKLKWKSDTPNHR